MSDEKTIKLYEELVPLACWAVHHIQTCHAAAEVGRGGFIPEYGDNLARLERVLFDLWKYRLVASCGFVGPEYQWLVDPHGSNRGAGAKGEGAQ